MHRIMWCDVRSIHSTAERGLSASLSGPMAHRADCRWLTQPTHCAASTADCSASRSAHLLLSCLCLLAYACLCFLSWLLYWLFYGSSVGSIGSLPMGTRNRAPRGCIGLTDGLWDQSLHACTREDSLQWPQKLVGSDLRRFVKQMD